MRSEKDLFVSYLAGDETPEGRRTRALFEVLCDIRSLLSNLDSRVTTLEEAVKPTKK